MLRALFDRYTRMGMIRNHWVVEWHKRRVPHLHISIWFPQEMPKREIPRTIKRHWLEVSEPYGSAPRSQTVKRIHAFGGWAEYISKHAARGAKHAQRSIDVRPEGWEKSGRIWGKRGDWVLIEPLRIEICEAGYQALKRKVRHWRIERAGDDPLRIAFAESMYEGTCPIESHMRGFSEWIPRDEMLQMVNELIEEGFEVLINPTTEERINSRLTHSVSAKSDTSTL